MASDRIKFSNGLIREAVCPSSKQQIILRDSEQPGLGLRVTRGGAKTLIFQGKLAGNVIRMSIGDPETWSIQSARAKARELKSLVDAGRDPRQVKAEKTSADQAARERARQESAPAIEAWRSYIEARTSKWSERHRADHENMVRAGGEPIGRGKRPGIGDQKEPGILRKLLERPLSELTRDRIAGWRDEQVQIRPTRTRLALSLLSTFLTWCGDQPEYRDQVVPDACARMKRDLPKPRVKDDCLEREQLKLWFDAVRQIPSRTQSNYLQCLLLLGCRRNELAELEWENVDLRWDRLTIRDKVEGERTIPLPPYVKSLLVDLAPAKLLTVTTGEAKPTSRYVFASSTSASGHITEPRIAHNRALAMAGLPPLTLHGLRRSFATLSEWIEAPAGVVAQIMGHKPSAIAEKHYRRRPIDLLRSWHTKIEAWILGEAGVEQPFKKAVFESQSREVA